MDFQTVDLSGFVAVDVIRTNGPWSCRNALHLVR